MPVDVLCIGNVGYDFSLYVPDYPLENRKYEAQALLEAGGGPAANAAYLLSTWGVPCAVAGLLGEDRYARVILEEYHAAGTDTSLLEVRPGHQTTVSMVLVNQATSSRTIITHKTERTTPYTLPAARLAGRAPRVLLVDGHELPASLEALGAFPAAVSLLDAGSWREGTAVLAPRVGYLAASERFAAEATGRDQLATAEEVRAAVSALRARYGNAVLVTLGERGAAWDFGEGYHTLPAFPVHAVDTTGAGDIFHGAFAYGLLCGMTHTPLVRFASIAAALSVTRQGGRPSVPGLGEVEKMAKVPHVP